MARKILVIFLVLGIIFSLNTIKVNAIDFDLGKVLKVVGIGAIVAVIAKPLNDFINELTINKNLGTEAATKVVPIVSLGTGGYIGAAQVVGPKEAVETARAVAQLEIDWQDQARVKILIPIDNLNPLEGVRRVKGVGISAVIDIKI